MATNSDIEWTNSTWNPVTGCTKVSDGCKNCYAERMAKRLQAMGQKNYRKGFNLSLHPESLLLPLTWKNPQIIVVNSMSDLFHEEIPPIFIKQVFEVMHEAHWHQFQILTKRSDRLVKLNQDLVWPSNVCMGVSVESQKYIHLVEQLRMNNARIKYISFEPLIGAIQNCSFEKIDWVIVGGESGPNARPVQKEWVMKIRDYCHNEEVPFFFKQWGGFNKKKSGRELDGRTWDEMPLFQFT